MVDPSPPPPSGISAGAAFATQMQVAYSSVISGSATWAGVPYLCFSHNMYGCMTMPSYVSVDTLIADTDKFEADGEIDPVSNLADARVYVFHGTEDTTVKPASSEKIQEFFNHYVDAGLGSVVSKLDLGATHAVVSDHVGTNCGHSDHELYIENCQFDSVYYALNHIMGNNLNPPLTPGSRSGNLVMFDQLEFFGGDVSMEDFGYYYLPENCADGLVVCRLHVFFHGCEMGDEYIGTDFIDTAGFIEVADANNIVLLFPEVRSTGMLGGDPLGCYDWFGYTGGQFSGAFATRSAPQMKGSYDMIARAAGLEA